MASRQQWSSSPSAATNVAGQRVVQPNAQDEYEQYLIMLQRRNRLLKKLRQKDTHQIEMEKREQGFALYLNGANVTRRQQPVSAKSSSVRQNRSSKTSEGTTDCLKVEEGSVRVKTAPVKRKSWQMSDFDLKTDKGELHMEPPGARREQYSDDFESYDTEGDMKSQEEDKPEIDVNVSACSSTGDVFTVSFEDISVLRESLESDAIITKSLVDSFSSDDEVNSEEEYGKSDEECEIEEVEEESFEEHGGDENGAEKREHTEQIVESPPRMSFQPSNEKKIVLEFGKPDLRPDKRDTLAPNNTIQTESQGTIISLESSSTVKSRPLTVTSKKVEKRILSDENIAELVKKQSIQNQGVTSSHNGINLTVSESSLKNGKEQDLSGGLENSDKRQGKPQDQMDSAVSALKAALAADSKHDLHGKGSIQSKEHDQWELKSGIQLEPKHDMVLSGYGKVATSAGATYQSQLPKKISLDGSLTERTLQVVTEKVRQMNSKQQSKLLSLLSNLDNELHSASTSTPQGHSPSSRRKAFLQGNNKDPVEKGDPGSNGILTTEEGKEDSRNVDIDEGESEDHTSDKGRAHTPDTNEKKMVVSTSNMDSQSSWKPLPIPDIPSVSTANTIPAIKLSSKEYVMPDSSTGFFASIQKESASKEEDPLWDSPRLTRPSSSRTTGERGRITRASAGQTSTNLSEWSKDQEDAGKACDDWFTGTEETRSCLHTGMLSTDSERCDSDLDLLLPFRKSSRGSRSRSRRDDAVENKDKSDLHRDRAAKEQPEEVRTSVCGGSSKISLTLDLTSMGDSVVHEPSHVSSHKPRVKTAVLHKGKLPPLLLPSSNTKTSLKQDSDCSTEPSVIKDYSSRTSRYSGDIPDPIQSSTEPKARGSVQHFKQRGAQDSTYTEDLASLDKFNHSYSGQIKHNIKDDILETFLSEYRKKKNRHASHLESQQQSSAQPTSAGVSGLCSIQRSPPEAVLPAQDSHFSIPELPIGKELVFSILTTWGDKYYVGLTGIEVFTASGEPAVITEITADPSDINVLPEYDSDPRVVSNLVDGINQTRDDLHMWLTPYTRGTTHMVKMKFPIPYAISMIRVWNYNKSRIHSSRGVRHAQIFLDDQMIFNGEIAKATGSGTSLDSETILFTLDDDVLFRVSKHDSVYQTDQSVSLDPSPIVEYEENRPETADCDNKEGDMLGLPRRPFTQSKSQETMLMNSSQPKKDSIVDPDYVLGSEIQIVLKSNWGDSSSIGLTGISVLLADSQDPLQIRPDQLDVVMPPVSSQEGSSLQQQVTEISALVNEDNLTTDAAHMWVCMLPAESAAACPTLFIKLDEPKLLKGLRVWNYNASLEDSYKGVKTVHLFVDGKIVACGADGQTGGEDLWLLRRAPGHVLYNFSQDLVFTKRNMQQSGQEYGHSENGQCLPQGFVFQIQLFSTWGDPYYIGLNGLEFYDAKQERIALTRDNIAAFPESVNVLPSISNDVRTPDKLVDGVNDTSDAQHMWLTPVFPGVTNSIFVIFDQVHTLSLIKLWNYAKTPARGVKNLAVLVDDLLVFTGIMPMTPSYARGILPTVHIPLEAFTISFIDSSHGLVSASSSEGLTSKQGDVQFINNQTVVSVGSRKHQLLAVDQELRPLTSLTDTAQNRKTRRI